MCLENCCVRKQQCQKSSSPVPLFITLESCMIFLSLTLSQEYKQVMEEEDEEEVERVQIKYIWSQVTGLTSIYINLPQYKQAISELFKVPLVYKKQKQEFKNLQIVLKMLHRWFLHNSLHRWLNTFNKFSKVFHNALLKLSIKKQTWEEDMEKWKTLYIAGKPTL